MTAPPGRGPLRRVRRDVAASPFIVIWEATRACAPACLHCRAGAVPDRNPAELGTEEAYRLVRQVTDVGAPPPLFTALREPDRLGGRCGACEFRTICGGSRSRAYACSGDVLGEEPWCAYEPGSFPYQKEPAAHV
ncbi:hypothetical protein ACIA8R_49405 [Nonomuraea sp. NPDC051191]|uniref:hypothetical protein n=1 Tax=Nonomuraea sp. NPDC051191 TaxID=3364372 RepID=UPI0037BB2C2F